MSPLSHTEQSQDLLGGNHWLVGVQAPTGLSPMGIPHGSSTITAEKEPTKTGLPAQMPRSCDMVVLLQVQKLEMSSLAWLSALQCTTHCRVSQGISPLNHTEILEDKTQWPASYLPWIQEPEKHKG